MISFELTEDVILTPGDGINESVPWRLGKRPAGRALTPEQEASLVARFGLDAELIETVSKMLSIVLDPDIMPNWIPVDEPAAEKKGKAKLQRACDGTAKLKEQLTEHFNDLESLDTTRRAPDEVRAAFEGARTNLALILRLLEGVPEGLRQTLNTPGAVRLGTPTDKRRVSDQRRDMVLQVLFKSWRKAGKRMKVRTDGVTYKRGGDLIEFVNTVVTCVTEPPTELPGETIKQKLEVFREVAQQGFENARISDKTSTESS